MQASALHSYPVFPVQERPARRRKGTMRRRRTVTLAFLFVLLVVAITLVVLPRSGATLPRTAAPALASYTVAPGDTLWSIAEQYGNGREIRSVIESIKETNHLQTATLQPGQQLLVPAVRG